MAEFAPLRLVTAYVAIGHYESVSLAVSNAGIFSFHAVYYRQRLLAQHEQAIAISPRLLGCDTMDTMTHSTQSVSPVSLSSTVGLQHSREPHYHRYIRHNDTFDTFPLSNATQLDRWEEQSRKVHH